MRPAELIADILHAAGKKIAHTDRMGMVAYAFFAYALFIAFTGFRYSVLDYDYYRTLAEKQQTITVKNPVSRGSIYSNNDPIGVFATSTDLPDLSVDPQAPGSKERLYPFLTDAVFAELCQNGGEARCSENVAAFARLEPDAEAPAEKDAAKALIREELNKRIEKEYVDFVLVKERLSSDEIAKVPTLSFSGFFVVL